MGILFDDDCITIILCYYGGASTMKLLYIALIRSILKHGTVVWARYYLVNVPELIIKNVITYIDEVETSTHNLPLKYSMFTLLATWRSYLATCFMRLSFKFPFEYILQSRYAI